jgi:hypothetical protein
VTAATIFAPAAIRRSWEANKSPPVVTISWIRTTFLSFTSATASRSGNRSSRLREPPSCAPCDAFCSNARRLRRSHHTRSRSPGTTRAADHWCFASQESSTRGPGVYRSGGASHLLELIRRRRLRNGAASPAPSIPRGSATPRTPLAALFFENFAMLEDRLRCPRCGSRYVRGVVRSATQPSRQALGRKPDWISRRRSISPFQCP